MRPRTPNQKYVMLESEEFNHLREKFLGLLKSRIETVGPDEICAIFEIFCEKFSASDNVKSWKRIPTISSSTLAKIKREELEELLDIEYSNNTTVHEKALSTDWDSVLSGILMKKEVDEDDNK